MGRAHDAIAVLEAAHAEAAGDPVFIAALVHARASAGDRSGAMELLGTLCRLDRQRYVSGYHLALAHVAMR